MLYTLKAQIKSLMPVAACIVACLTIISSSSVISQGIIGGLETCLNVIIPTLFPFMIFSSFVVKSGIYLKIGRIFGKPIGWIFNLPPQTSGVIIMGFIGGYPIGLTMTAKLFEAGAIEEHHAKRMALFCVNAGPAFIISAVGGVMYQSKDVGLILFASVVLASLTVGVAVGIFSKIKGEKAKSKRLYRDGVGIASALVSATESSARAMLSICVWVVVFGAIISYVRSFELPNEISTILCGLLEVTSGCSASVGSMPLSVVAAFISFSGLCIFFQLLPLIRQIGLRASSFLLSRIVCACLSFIYCQALTRLFPGSVQVFSNIAAPLAQGFSVSIPATICLILTCIVLIFDVDRKKKMC